MTFTPHIPHHQYVLRLGGWANLTIAAVHVLGLLWAWSMFRFVGIEAEMREIATQGSALPYVFTLIPAAACFVFGVYALSAAGDVRRLPRLQVVLVAVAVIYVYRATFYGGFEAVREGDVAQIAFAVIALLIGLAYAYGAAARRGVEARAMLADAGRAENAVRARIPKEHAPFLVWGAFLAIVIPGFDLIDRTVWGWATIAIALVLMVATAVYFVMRERDVRVGDRTPSWTWVALTAGVCAGGAFAEGFDDAIAVSYVIGGLIAAAPMLAWGDRLRRDV